MNIFPENATPFGYLTLIGECDIVIRRRAEKILKRKKKEYLKKRIERSQELQISNKTRKFHGAVKYINRGSQPKTNACKDQNGIVIEGKAKTIDKWAYTSVSL